MLDWSTDYYVVIPATGFHDLSNNDFLGITASTSWNFTTEQDSTVPVSVVSPTAPNTGLRSQPMWTAVVALVIGIGLMSGYVVHVRRAKKESRAQ